MAEQKYNEIKLNINNININKGNPRFEKANTDLEALHKMLDNHSVKIYNLAEHISIYGVNPTEVPIVYKENNNHILLDGNRRITALKILNNPELLNHKYKDLKDKIMKLNRSGVPSNIDVIEFPNEEDANIWVNIKHTGENDGVGTVKWTALQQSRFDKDRYPLSSQLIDFMNSNKLVKKENKYNLNNLKISNLERLLTDPDVRKMLSIQQRNKVLYCPPLSELLKNILNNLIFDISKESFTVNTIHSKADRIEYIRYFKLEYNINNEEKEVLEADELKPIRAPAPSTDDLNKNLKVKPNTVEKEKPKTDDKPSSNKVNVKERENTQNRKYLIPKSFKLNISNAKINDIYTELKKVGVEEYPNIVGAAFRIFLELSIDYYIEQNKSELNVRENDKLKNKMEKVKNNINSTLQLDSSEFKNINRAIGSNNNIISIDTLHGYIHSTVAQASPDGLKTTWNNYELFFQYLYDVINNYPMAKS